MGDDGIALLYFTHFTKAKSRGRQKEGERFSKNVPSLPQSSSLATVYTILGQYSKVEKILKGSLDGWESLLEV